MTPEQQKYFNQYKGLAYFKASDYCRKFSHLISKTDFDDLKQEALMGLLRACETYDEEKAKFVTWAPYYIRHYILAYLKSKQFIIREPSYIHERRYKGDNTKKRPAFLEGIYHNEEYIPIVDLLEDDNNPNIEDILNFKWLLLQIKKLSERDRYIIEQRFLKEKKLREIGAVLSLTKERVRQIEQDIIEEIRSKKNGENN